jgi:fluoroquinolone transport system permease protein
VTGARLRTLVALEARLLWRHRVVALVAALTAGWTAMLAALPAAVARAAAPWVLLLETAVLTTTVAGALVIMERDQGVRAAFATSPARVRERMLARVGLLAALVLASAVPLALAAGPHSAYGFVLALVGVGLTAALAMLLAVAVAVRRQSVITFMVMLPLVLLPLVLAALLHGAGITHRLLYAVPTTGAMDLIRAGFHDRAPGTAGSIGWLLAASAAAAWLVGHRFRRAAAVTTAPRRARRRAGRRPWARGWLGFDLVTLRRDPLLLVIAASPVLLGLGLRFGYPPARDWLLRAYGFDLDPYRPVLLGLAIVLHVPFVFGMIGALLVLDDAASRALAAVRVSPLTLPRYLARRAGLVAVATVAGLAVAVPMSGLAPVTGAVLVALLPATLLAPLVLLATVALAGDRVQGVAVLKLLGLPLYLPVAAWWWSDGSGWLLAALPSWWVLAGLWRSWGYAAVGVLVISGLLAGLLPLALRRLTPLSGTGSEGQSGLR